MKKSIFTQIINGQIPCHKVYEDSKTFVFMDINPIQPGMVLVVPKLQIENYEDLPQEDLTALFITCQKISRAQRKIFPDKKKMSMQIEGLDVPHVHVKLFPINSAAEFHARMPTSPPNHDELAKIADKLQTAL